MTPRAARPALAIARTGRLSDARRALADTRVGDDEIDGIPGACLPVLERTWVIQCHHLPWLCGFMHGGAVIVAVALV
jgi:hypothetical protein